MAAAWIKGQSADSLREQLARGTILVDLDGRKIEIRPDDVVYTSVLAEGFVEATGGSGVVKLTTAPNVVPVEFCAMAQK